MKVCAVFPKPASPRIIEAPGRPVVRRENPGGDPSDLPAQLRPVVRIDDRSGMHHGDGCLDPEDLGTLDEEGPKLAVEEGKALVDLDLGPVGLDLREVRVDGEVGREIRRDPVLDVQPGIGIRVLVHEPGERRVELAVLDRGQGGEELEVAARRDVRHPLEDPHLREEARLVSRDRAQTWFS